MAPEDFLANYCQAETTFWVEVRPTRGQRLRLLYDVSLKHAGRQIKMNSSVELQLQSDCSCDILKERKVHFYPTFWRALSLVALSPSLIYSESECYCHWLATAASSDSSAEISCWTRVANHRPNPKATEHQVHSSEAVSATAEQQEALTVFILVYSTNILFLFFPQLKMNTL